MGSPQKHSFCGVKILSYKTNSPSPYQGEGDKGDRVSDNIVAEGVGFEPTAPKREQRFSRPSP